jgi:hypothetical protein
MKKVLVSMALLVSGLAIGFGSSRLLVSNNTEQKLGAYGYATATSSSVLVASASSTTVLANNPGRMSAKIVNDCGYAVYLSFGNTAVKGTGVRLNPFGGSFETDPSPGDIFNGAINAIASISDGTDYCNVTTLEN